MESQVFYKTQTWEVRSRVLSRMDTVHLFDAKDRLLEQLGWEENPFVKDLRAGDKETFLRYYLPFEATHIVNRLAFDTKACLLLGPKGVGKTSALYYVLHSLPSGEFLPIFLKEPPASLGAFAGEAGLVSRRKGLFGGLAGLFGGQKVPGSRREVADALRQHDKKVVLFLDEAHLAANPAMYMEFKYFLDEVPNLRLVMSSLGPEPFPDSLLHLVGEPNTFQRRHFSVKEMVKIIAHRIRAVGGEGVEPFDKRFLAAIFTEQNLLTPRYIFDELNSYLGSLAMGQKPAQIVADYHAQRSRTREELVEEGVEEEEFEHQVDSAPYKSDPIVRSAVKRSLRMAKETKPAREAPVEAAEEDADPLPALVPAPKARASVTRGNADWWPLLSPSQQQVMDCLVKSPEGLSLSDLMKSTSLRQDTCFNALYQLRGSDAAEVSRKPEVPFPLVVVKARRVGRRKKNVYFPSPKIKNLFTLH